MSLLGFFALSSPSHQKKLQKKKKKGRSAKERIFYILYVLQQNPPSLGFPSSWNLYRLESGLILLHQIQGGAEKYSKKEKNMKLQSN